VEEVSTTTPPQELFRELADLGNLVFSMLTGPQVVVKRWPAYYLVYVQIDGLCREVNRATASFSRGLIEETGSVSTERVEGANACLARIDGHCRTLVDLLARIEREALVNHGKPALKDVVSRHFSPESAWRQAFQQQYCAGRVAADGRVMERSVLLIDPYPNLGASSTVEVSLVAHQTFELASDQSRTVLARTTRKVQTNLNQVYAALGDFLVSRCPSISALLHPGTN
jgi:hypothetical protein